MTKMLPIEMMCLTAKNMSSLQKRDKKKKGSENKEKKQRERKQN